MAEFTALKARASGRVKEFDISPRFLTQEETKRGSTYCVIVTDETRGGHSLDKDTYTLSGAVIIYANDTTDPRAKLDLMIEDAIDVLRRAFEALTNTFMKAVVDSIQTTESSTAEGDWPQAVIRWNGIHRRAVMV
jgi:hypothetical protein